LNFDEQLRQSVGHNYIQALPRMENAASYPTVLKEPEVPVASSLYRCLEMSGSLNERVSYLTL
jgi:hypothetical protein